MTTEKTDKERALAQLEHALTYLQRGWHLVMMAEGTKGPTHKGWNELAELIDTPEKAVARLAQGPQNMGVVHEYSRTCAIDVDDEAWTREIWAQFGIDFDAVMAAGPRIWSKPNRDKVIFRLPEGLVLPLQKINWPAQNPRFANDVHTIFELRAAANQDVLPPSRHPDGHLYQWWPGTAPWEMEEIPLLPQALQEWWQQVADRDTGMREEIINLCPWKPHHEGRRYVQKARASSRDHGDVIGNFNQANDVGDLLLAGGYKKKGKRYLAPSSSTVIPGVVLLDGKCYSHHGSDVLADGYAHDAFDVFTILEHGGDVKASLAAAAQQLGIERRGPQLAPADMGFDLDAAMAAQKARLAAQHEKQAAVALPAQVQAVSHAAVAVATTAKMPLHLLKPPGMVGEAVEWILRTSQRPQPILAVGAALTMFSTILGQKVATSTGLRTNAYIVGVGGTSAGKDHARKAVKKMMAAGGMGDHLGGEEFGSGQGLLARVTRAPVTLFLPDEFGLLVAQIGNKKAASYEKAVMSILMKLFSSTGSVYNGTEYANQKDRARADVEYPCVSMYATTTPETFYPALNSGDVTSGWLNRMLVVAAPDGRVPWQDATLDEPPARMVAWIKAARMMGATGTSTLGNAPDNPIVVPMASMSETLFTQWRAWIEAHEDGLAMNPARAALAPLWGRAWEHAAKLALVLAVARQTDPEALRGGCLSMEIDMSSAAWAIDFVKYAMLEMEREVAERVGDSDLDRLCQAVLKLVTRAGRTGCTTRDLNVGCKPFRAEEGRVQDTVLEMLKRRGDVVLIQRPATIAGHKTVLVWALPEFGGDANVTA